jgi:signal transduction histidine kinase
MIDSRKAWDFTVNPGIKLRLTIFISTIALLLMLVAWTTHVAWQRIGELHEKFSMVQSQSFQNADHLQQAILGLNNLLLRYAASRAPDDWTNFDVGSTELRRWINEQQPILSEREELPLLKQIKAVFTNYVAAANSIHKIIYGNRQSMIRVIELADFEKQSKSILSLGLELARVHQQSLESFQRQTTQSLDILRFTLLGSLISLLAVGAWLSVVVYRGMIAPLKVQLVKSQRLLERQEKLASLGMLAAGVAHEIRNPLTAIKAWLFMQRKRLKPGTPEHEDANLIAGEISRLERIVKDFLQFARPSEPQLAVVPAEQTLSEVQKLMEPQLKKSNIKLALDGVASAQIRIDPEQVKQVLINLIQNAADSIGKDGSITLRARLDERRLFDRQTEVVILEVADTGKGIPPEVEKRLFDPFFTTKDSGTGLGLPIAARIVEKHQGALQYQTHANRGTTFGIILPRVEQ